MSTRTRRRVCTPSESASARETLSVDILLEIIVCSDVRTIVSWAATGKILRRAILEPAFRRRLAAAGFQFDPALLLAVSYLQYDGSNRYYTLRVVHTREPTRRRARAHEDAVSIHHHQWFMPVTARDVLLLRWCDAFRVSSQVDLHVCNTLTGQVTELPLATVSDVCHRVLLSVGDGGGSFEVLLVDDGMRFQIFSSKHGKWGDVRQASVTRHRHRLISTSSHQAIIGRTVYWLIRLIAWQHYQGGPDLERILALDVDGAEATMMELPPGCISSLMPCHHNDKHLLLASVRGQLSLLVTESLGISMWTLTSGLAATWSRRLVIGAREILRQAELKMRNDLTRVLVNLEGFGEKSGSLILSVGSRMLFRLDLGKEEAPVVVKRLGSVECWRVEDVFLHEIDRISLLQAMKSF